MSKRETMTTSAGAPIADNQNSVSAGAPPGRTLRQRNKPHDAANANQCTCLARWPVLATAAIAFDSMSFAGKATVYIRMSLSTWT